MKAKRIWNFVPTSYVSVMVLTFRRSNAGGLRRETFEALCEVVEPPPSEEEDWDDKNSTRGRGNGSGSGRYPSMSNLNFGHQRPVSRDRTMPSDDAFATSLEATLREGYTNSPK